eukprot:scaffold51164_cov59-Phaeocystis_antarctica.AAC.4
MALHGSRAVAPQAEAWRAPRASRSPRAPPRPNDPIHRACWRRGGRRSRPGRLRTCPRAAQGEGAIEGHYTDYERPRLHEHGGLRFGRFVCGAGYNPSSCAVQDLMPLNRQAPPLNAELN